MKKIVNFFRPSSEQDNLTKSKTDALIFVSLFGMAFLGPEIFIYFKLNPSPGSELHSNAALIMFILTITNIFILKYTSIKIAGNIYGIGLILILLFLMNSEIKTLDTIEFFHSSFYTILAFLSLSALFATKLALIVNFILILTTTTRIFLFGLKNSPELTDTFKTGFIEHVLTLVILTLILYFIAKFNENALKKEHKNSIEKDTQNKKLMTLFGKIEASSMELLQASNELSNSSEQVSESTNEQASTSEEVSASIEQMLATITQNTENSEKSFDKITESSQSVEKNNEVLFKTIELVNQISEKISIISEIASKTDILSINAAIEAARAGDVGRGFAVVAQEIRKLADNSKKAANEIKTLSEQGVSISKIAGKALNELLPEIQQSADIIQNITVASAEQQLSAETINTSVLQLTQTTNQNSAIAEQLSASAEELNAQAQQLRQIMEEFKDQ